MARIVFKAAEGLISDKQYAAAYALAAKAGVGTVLYGNSGGLAPVHHFLAQGDLRRLVGFMGQVTTVFPTADTSRRVWLTLWRAYRER